MSGRTEKAQQIAVTPAVRRSSKCSRDPAAGPGTCWFWWELCPEKVKDCYLRRASAPAGGDA